MKKIFTIILIFLSTYANSFAQESPYQKAMKKELEKFSHADTLPAYTASANAFQRIAALNKTEWLPLYYNALALVYGSFDKSLNLDKKDATLGEAEAYVKQAQSISTDNSEIEALYGFVLMAKLSADPGSRGQTMSGQVMQHYGKARALDKDNPRALALMAQMEYGMAQFFKSGTEKACGMAKQSLAIFAQQDDAKLKEEMLPTWGKRLAEQIDAKCK